MSSRKKKANRQRGYAKDLILKHLPKTKCHNCGEDGPHFIPPSFDVKGQFHCEKKEETNDSTNQPTAP